MSVRAAGTRSWMTYRNLNGLRKGFQLFALAFLVAVPILNWMGVHWVVGTLYAISIGALDIADPVMALQTVLLTREVYIPLLLAAAIPALLALVFGRVFCSWMCPYNTMLDWIDAGKRRVFRKRWLKARRRPITSNPRPALYWGVFGALLVAVVLVGLPLMGWLSVPGILTSQFSQTVLGMGPGLELALVAGLLVGEVAIARRAWCTYACPVGAMLSVFRTPKTMRVVRDANRCSCKPGAEACRVACPVGLLPFMSGVEPYCYNCGSCIATCEKTRRSALRFGFGGAGAASRETGVFDEDHAHTMKRMEAQ